MQHKIRFVTSLSIVVGCIASLAHAAVAQEEDDRWYWNEDDVSVEHWISSNQSMFEVEAVGMDDGLFSENGRLKVGDGSTTLVEFAAHTETPFVIFGSQLVYAKVHPIASGCQLTAIDLTTGERVWEIGLRGLGPIAHSRYRNRVILKRTDKSVIVYAQESSGRYIEEIAWETGELLDHFVLPRE